MISQMLWSVTHFYHRNTNKVIYCYKSIFCWFYPLLGENGYKYCLNTPTPSLTLIMSQMKWIVIQFYHRNTNKAIYCFYAIFVSFSLFWDKMGVSVV
ncbi:hypothetical protein AtNW77_Chr1g0042051 [Arabidopsis thaliana]